MQQYTSKGDTTFSRMGLRRITLGKMTGSSITLSRSTLNKMDFNFYLTIERLNVKVYIQRPGVWHSANTPECRGIL